MLCYPATSDVFSKSGRKDLPKTWLSIIKQPLRNHSWHLFFARLYLRAAPNKHGMQLLAPSPRRIQVIPNFQRTISQYFKTIFTLYYLKKLSLIFSAVVSDAFAEPSVLRISE